MIFTFTSFIASVMGGSGPNRVDRTNLTRACPPCAMDWVTGMETPSGAVSVSASAREGVLPPPGTTQYWLTKAFNTFRTLELCWLSPN